MTKNKMTKTTVNLNLKLNFCSWLATAFCIFLVCAGLKANATEISPLIGFGQENFSFDVDEFAPGSKKINFQPNIAGVTRIGLNYGDFGVGVGFRGSSKDLDSAKGSTDFFDLQLSYQTRQWGIEGFYQTYKGFYNDASSTTQVFPDLSFKHFGLMGRYALSDGAFAVNALMDQSDEIVDSPVKFFAVGGIRQHDLSTTTSLLTGDFMGENTDLESMRRLKVMSLNLGLGVGKYWVSSSRLFIGGVFDVLATTGFYNYETASGTSSSATYVTPSYDLRLGLGYAGTTFKTGVSFAADLTTLKTLGGAIVKPSANRLLLYFRFVF